MQYVCLFPFPVYMLEHMKKSPSSIRVYVCLRHRTDMSAYSYRSSQADMQIEGYSGILIDCGIFSLRLSALSLGTGFIGAILAWPLSCSFGRRCRFMGFAKSWMILSGTMMFTRNIQSASLETIAVTRICWRYW